MYRLLEKGVETDFSDDQINLSHVAALIQKNKVSDVIIPTSLDPLYEESIDSVYAITPPDFFWLINSRVEALADPLDCELAPSLNTTTTNEYVAVVPFPSIGSAPYYSNTSITSTTQGTLYTSPSSIASGFNNPNSAYVVQNNIIETLYRKYSNIKVYWERYRDKYYQNSFIFVGSINLGTITVTSGGQSSTATSSATAYTTYNRSLIPSLTSKTIKIVPVKTTEGDLLYQVLKQNSLYKTDINEVVMDESYDYFTLYRNKSFLITRLYYDYIRKPRTISLNLNQSCELAASIHPKIVDLTVELLRLDIKDPSYQQTLQDTQLRTS